MTLVADFVLQRLSECAPIPPHIMKEQGEKAAVRNPEGLGVAAEGVRQKLTEFAGHLPGRH
ncbi:hypothetical protein ACF1B0_28685 [Streptomyces anandii]|uniref:hypothetical protein n=1 Tax=Streptomyces anandii TaxID=285454 RepID=UPI0036F52333